MEDFIRMLRSLFGRAGTYITKPKNTLLELTPQDFWTEKDAHEGIIILGAVGSGKSSGSGNTIARKFLQNGMGGIVLTVKPDECGNWKELARECGRENDLIVFSPSNPYRFNFLEQEQLRKGEGGRTH